MKKKLCIERLEGVLKVVTMEQSAFNIITAGYYTPIFLLDGSPVTEGNVTQFIRERTARWREAWIVGPIDTVIKELKK